MLRKFRMIIFLVAALWFVALVQILITRFYVSHTSFTQAFARNQVEVISDETLRQEEDLRNRAQGNQCVVGSVDGKLSESERVELAGKLFGEFGGAAVADSLENIFSDYYVAYGYTTGIKESRNVGGKRINLNVAISYDEEKNKTKIYMGSPLINTDF